MEGLGIFLCVPCMYPNQQNMERKRGFENGNHYSSEKPSFSRIKFSQPYNSRGFGIHWQMNIKVRLDETVWRLVRRKTERTQVLVLQAIAILTRTVARAAYSRARINKKESI